MNTFSDRKTVRRSCIFILEGEVEVGSINLNGKITRMSMLAEGEYFGEVELFLRQPGYSCYARARKKATLLGSLTELLWRKM